MSRPDDKRRFGRNNLSVVSKLSPEQVQAIWAEVLSAEGALFSRHSNAGEHVPFTDCWLWKASHASGYACKSQGHAKPKIRLHIVAAWIRFERTPGPTEVVSHLCHRKRCINPDHLMIERITANNQRMRCLRALETETGKVYNLCPHQPRCLRTDLPEFEPEVELDPDWFTT